MEQKDVKVSDEIKKILIDFQRSEITEHHIYMRLADRTSGKNSEILRKIGQEELGHYRRWKRYSGVDVKPNRFKIWLYMLIARVFGLTFALKMMENGEQYSEAAYRKVLEIFPDVDEIIQDEERHELELIDLIDEEKIGYIGSMVLGLNDALVELTGTLAGLTFALRNTHIVGIAGLITGIAASLSMAASEYLSQKSEAEGKNPFKAAIYTGIAYIVTVTLMVMPYFIISKYYFALLATLVVVVSVIFIFTFYISVVKGHSFKPLFTEMLAISLGVALISFLIGMLVRVTLGVDVD